MIRLIATDIDGTLVEEGTIAINPEYYDVIKELRNRGVRVIAASGRQRSSIEKVFAPIVDELSFISENGTAVYSKDYEFVNTIPVDVAREYIREARTFPGCEVMINHDNMSYLENEAVYHYMIDGYGYNGKLVDDIEEYLEGICKISIYHHNSAEKVISQKFMERWGKTMDIVVSGEHWLDCTNKGGNKGTALQHFQEAYKISPDETLAFGDNINDIAMLERASHSFAVENAREEVKEAANFIAPSYKEDGVLQVLKAVLRGELA